MASHRPPTRTPAPSPPPYYISSSSSTVLAVAVEEDGGRDHGWQDKTSHRIEPGAWRHTHGGRQLESLGLPPDVVQLYVVQGGSPYIYIPRGQYFNRSYRPAEIQAMVNSIYPAWASVLFVHKTTMMVLFSSSAPTKNHGSSDQTIDTGYIFLCCITCCGYL